MFVARRSRIVGVLVLMLLVMSVFAESSVHAAPGNGAIHISDAHCHDDDGYITCFTAEGVANETITPSGNAIYTGYVRVTFILRDPAGTLVSEGSSESHFQRLDTDGLLHVLSQQLSSTMTRADGTSCTSTYHAHLVNGEIQFEHDETVCS